ncbi:MAG: hypothetical protein EOO65_02805 [Methanosarcinales archaeon]|nr:MAG: hypothetical protein EOO65_02805 [Methanosarcinales archaeon]
MMPLIMLARAGSMSQFEEYMATRKREAGELLQRSVTAAAGKGVSGQDEVLQRVLEAVSAQPLSPSELQRKQRYPVILLLLMLEAFACMYTVMYSQLSSILDGIYVGKTYVVPVASALFTVAHHFGHVAVFVFFIELLVDLFDQQKQRRIGSVWRWADAALESAAAWIWMSTWSDRTCLPLCANYFETARCSMLALFSTHACAFAADAHLHCARGWRHAADIPDWHPRRWAGASS